MLTASAGCLMLTAVSLLWGHGLQPSGASLLRFTICLAANIVTTMLILRNGEARDVLRVSESRYRTIFNTLAVAIWEHDFCPVKRGIDALRAEGVVDLRRHLSMHPEFVGEMRATVRITDVNDTALRMMGVANKDEFFTCLSEFLPDSDESFADCILAIDEGSPRFESETTVRTKQGEELRVLLALTFPPDGRGLDRIQGSFIDITERRRMEEALGDTRAELEKVMRAATIGAASASIAHEVNQPIAAVTTYADAAIRWMERDPPNLPEVRQAIDSVAIAAKRAEDVIARVRSLLGNAEPERSMLAIDEVIREATRLVRRELDAADVVLSIDLQAPDATVLGDRVLLQQMLINLMLNGVQAMWDTTGKSIHVSTAVSGGHVAIAIADSGPGFPPGAAAHAFDAFYSTKSSGMGLGLAICKWTIDAHDGEIEIGANDGAPGARLEVRLPFEA